MEEGFQENLDYNFCRNKNKANVAEKASALVAATDHGGKFLNTFTPIINSAWIIDSGATDQTSLTP